MKKLSIILGLISIPVVAQNVQDVESIKAMTGCYEVKFNFAETFAPEKTYEKKKNYHSHGLEWVELIEDKPGKLVLQHILIVNPKGKGKDAVVKHWRQDWLYQNTDFYDFHKGNLWKYRKAKPEEVKGQWTQNVYQVDDSPRYSASGTWVHIDGKHYWQTQADAPLPRREYTTRNDYNVLERSNRHELTSWGWIHDQDNRKLLREDGKEDRLITEEKGKEYYRKTDAARCQPARDYWAVYAPVWKAVRETWQSRLDQHRDLTLKAGVEDTYLYTPLMELEPGQETKAKQKILDFIQK